MDSTRLDSEGMLLAVSKRREIAKRTDGAVKTTEAWWAFGVQLWDARFFFGPVGLLAAAMTAGAREVFSAISSFGWAGWVLAGVPLFIISAVIFFALSWLWYLRPGGARRLSDKSAIENAQAAEKKVGADFDGTETLRQIPLSAVVASLREIEKGSSENNRLISNFESDIARLEGEIKTVRARSDAVKDALIESVGEVKRSVLALSESTEQFKSRVFRLLLAKQRIDRAVTLAQNIKTTGASLKEIKDTRPEDQDEEAWRTRFECNYPPPCPRAESLNPWRHGSQ